MEDQVEEEFFLDLFKKVYESINGNQVPSVEIEKAIKKIVDHFKDNKSPAGACDVQKFSTFGDLLGYFFWSSPLSAGVTRNKTLLAIRNCEEFRKRLQHPSLKVVSVGGGTGSDLVGLYSALCEEKCGFKSMEITLMDNNREWEKFQRAVEDNLRKNDFGNASKLIKEGKINTSFICADFGRMTPNALSVLKNANIVWMKGLLSILKNEDERYTITQKIIEPMTSGALLVVTDSPYYVNFGEFGTTLRIVWQPNDKEIDTKYELKIPDQEYKLARETKQQMFIYERI